VTTEPVTTEPVTTEPGAEGEPVTVVVLQIVGQTPAPVEVERIEERMRALGYGVSSRMTGDEVELRITGMDEEAARANFQVAIQVELRPVLSVTTATTDTQPSPGAAGSDGIATFPDGPGENHFTLGEEIDIVVAIAPGVSTQIVDGEWGVVARLSSRGREVFNRVAADCFARRAVCPEGQLALVLEGAVILAVTVGVPEFDEELTLSGSFTEDEANALAQALEYASLPASYEVLSIDVI
jgi:preprotein translocase subunit SecD